MDAWRFCSAGPASGTGKRGSSRPRCAWSRLLNAVRMSSRLEWLTHGSVGNAAVIGAGELDGGGREFSAGEEGMADRGRITGEGE